MSRTHPDADDALMDKLRDDWDHELRMEAEDAARCIGRDMDECIVEQADEEND